jgi:hypothetical protein
MGGQQGPVSGLLLQRRGAAWIDPADDHNLTLNFLVQEEQKCSSGAQGGMVPHNEQQQGWGRYHATGPQPMGKPERQAELQ